MNDELISIIVPVFNTEKYLKACLNSIINQTYKNLEIIIVNDGSTDKSEEICLETLKNDNRIRYYKCENSGVSYARNYGLKNSLGKYIAFIDSDDFVDQYYIEKMYRLLLKEKSDIIFSNYVLYKEKEKKIIEQNVELKNYSNFIEFILENREAGICGKLIKKECITNLFEENISIAEDMLFWTSNAKNIKNYCYTNEYLYYYNIHDGSLMHQNEIHISKKEISELIALKKAVEIVPDDLKYLFQFRYVNTFLKLNAYIDKTRKGDLKEYFVLFKTYLKEVLKASKIENRDKIKIIIKYKLFYLYKFFKVKLKKEKY